MDRIPTPRLFGKSTQRQRLPRQRRASRVILAAKDISALRSVAPMYERYGYGNAVLSITVCDAMGLLVDDDTTRAEGR